MTRFPPMSRESRCLRIWLLSSLVLLQILLTVSQAQITSAITSDGTLGTTVTHSGTTHTITGGTRPGNGPNLFHSFDRFSVGTGDTASFTGPTGITNILSRVTGGQQSVIDGVLRSEIAGANLYLLNPSGVLFSSNARLNVSGSFHVSTADVLRFADGATFSAHLGQASVLTVAEPAAFGFLGHNPAGITIQGSTLQVPAGKALSVVGGDIEVVGRGPLTAASVPTLGAPRGRLQLASVASPGEVIFSPLELAPDLQVGSFAHLGRLALSQGALLDVSGDGGGTVLLRSGRLRVDGSRMLADNTGLVDGTGLGMDLRIAADAVMAHGSRIATDSVGAGRARDLRLTAGTLHIDDSLLGSRPFAAGEGGNLVVDIGSLALTAGGQISTTTRGSGRGGTLSVMATDSIAMAGRDQDGNRSGLFNNTFGVGDAGRLSVSTPLLTMDDALMQANAAAGSSGNAGSVEVQAGRLTLTGGARISSSTSGLGRGGSVAVTATDTIDIAGRDSQDSGSGLISSTSGQGDAGRLFISAPLLTMDESALLSTGASLGSQGNAGNIEVRVGRLTLTGGALITSGTSGLGRGGEVTVVATDSIAIAGQGIRGTTGLLGSSGLFSSTSGQGDAGRLFISAPLLTVDESALLNAVARSGSSGNAGSVEVRVGRLTLTGGAQISSRTEGPGRGGEVTVVATDSIAIAGRDSQGFPSGLFSNTSSSGDAGRLSVSTPLLTMEDGAIQANAAAGSTGNAGSLEVRGGRLALTGGAQISTTTRGPGRGGELTVEATDSIAMAGRNSQGSRSGLFSNTFGAGDAGRLSVATPLLQMDNGHIRAETSGDGNAGNMEVRVGRLALTGGAQIFNGIGTSELVDGILTFSGTGGPGQGGDLTVVASEAIAITGDDSGLFSNALFGQGSAGHLSLSAPILTIDGGSIEALATRDSSGHAGNITLSVGRLTLSGGAQIVSSTRGTGRGGNIMVTATEALTIAGRDSQGFRSGLFSTTAGPMPGGNLQVTAPHIQLSNDGMIAASSSGTGDAGTISLLAGETFRSQQGVVTTGATGAGGGTIALQAGRLVQLQDSALTTTVQGGGGDAGNLTLAAPFIVADGSRIIANAFGGRGGNILIDAGVFLADPASLVSASSALGLSGTVAIQAPVTSLSGTLAPLPQAFVHVAALLPARCAMRWSGGQASSLVLGGREGLPADPGGLLPSPLVLDDRLVADPALMGAPPPQTSAATFALLAAHEQALPRFGCPP